MTLTVRTPTLVDAVGCAMAHHQVLKETLSGVELPDSFWSKYSQEALVSYWHQEISSLVGGRMALICQGRQIVGMGLVKNTSRADRGMGPAGRDLELAFFGMTQAHYDQAALQRLFDFVLGPTTPAQIWVYRSNQRLRRFLRVNGFTLDGLSALDPDTSVLMSRMTR